MTATHPIRAEFLDAMSAATDGQAAFAALHRMAVALVPARLFTVTLFDRPAGVVRRAYSSDPVVYPVGGTKPLGADEWAVPGPDGWPMFVSNDIADQKGEFADYDLIVSLGCRAAVNLPVALGGAVAATVNLLDAAGSYPHKAVRLIEDELRPAAMLAVAVAARAG